MTMSDDRWTDRLSEYLDDELDHAEWAALEAHLEGCEACRETLAELRAVVAGAAMLPDREPDRDLWPGIENGLTPRSRSRPARFDGDVPIISLADRRRVTVTVPQLVAAAIALVLFSAGGVWLALSGSTAGPQSVAVAPRPAAAGQPAVTLTSAYEQAVNELEGEFARRRTELDPETIVVVERNLAIIDQAIAEARAALAADPSSEFLNSHLAENMRRKVDLLRTATRIERAET